MERAPFVYILASRFRGTLYIGVTSDLMRRIWEHRSGAMPGFTKRYGIHRLIYFEPFGDMELAIVREKQLKRWHRKWKINLIEEKNPHWEDLAVGLGFEKLPNPPPNPVMLNSFQHPASGRGADGELDPETSSG